MAPRSRQGRTGRRKWYPKADAPYERYGPCGAPRCGAGAGQPCRGVGEWNAGMPLRVPHKGRKLAVRRQAVPADRLADGRRYRRQYEAGVSMSAIAADEWRSVAYVKRALEDAGGVVRPHGAGRSSETNAYLPMSLAEMRARFPVRLDGGLRAPWALGDGVRPGGGRTVPATRHGS